MAKLVCALGILAAAITAQDQPETVIRTTTRLVQIRVMAENSHGDPVDNLRQDEIRLEDNRKPREIDFLTFEGGASPAANTPSASAAQPQSADIRNDFAVLLVDWLNSDWADRLYVRDEVNRLLHTFQPRQKVALYLLSHDWRMLHQFTNDTAELLDIYALTEEEQPNPFDPAPPGLHDPRYKSWRTLTLDDRMVGFRRKALDTITFLGMLADRLSHIPGRKSLLWVSSGFPIMLDARAVPGAGKEMISLRASTDALIDKLNRSNVAVYGVDCKGLGGQGFRAPDTLQEVSERTGGTAFIGRNDLASGMRLAFEDSQTGYTLGFTLNARDVPGVHEIQLRATRPGVHLRYRESYQIADGR